MIRQDFGLGKIELTYSRPSIRGRSVFGTNSLLAPLSKPWRTGANAATRLVTDHALVFGDKELPAGSYSVWTIPSEKGWTMMFNSQANVWGTEYNPAFDVLRVPMQSELIPELVEELTIQVRPAPQGGVLNVIWEKTKASVRFLIK